MIEWPRLGRRLSLAGSTFLTALLCVVFVHVQNPVAVTASTVGISLSSSVRGVSSLSLLPGSLIKRLSLQVMWAVLYGYVMGLPIAYDFRRLLLSSYHI
jgi:hypothetical protein